jgi:hypothetical protein
LLGIGKLRADLAIGLAMALIQTPRVQEMVIEDDITADLPETQLQVNLPGD